MWSECFLNVSWLSTSFFTVKPGKPWSREHQEYFWTLLCCMKKANRARETKPQVKTSISLWLCSYRGVMTILVNSKVNERLWSSKVLTGQFGIMSQRLSMVFLTLYSQTGKTVNTWNLPETSIRVGQGFWVYGIQSIQGLFKSDIRFIAA